MMKGVRLRRSEELLRPRRAAGARGPCMTAASNVGVIVQADKIEPRPSCCGNDFVRCSGAVRIHRVDVKVSHIFMTKHRSSFPLIKICFLFQFLERSNADLYGFYDHENRKAQRHEK